MVDEKTTTLIPNGELTLESYEYYRNNFYGVFGRSSFNAKQTTFRATFWKNAQNSVLPAEIYNAIVADAGKCLELVMISKDLTKLQVMYVHKQLRTIENLHSTGESLSKLLKNEIYNLDPSFLLELVSIVREKFAADSIILKQIILQIVAPGFSVSNETLIKIFYSKEHELYKVTGIMTDYRITWRLIDRLAKVYLKEQNQ